MASTSNSTSSSARSSARSSASSFASKALLRTRQFKSDLSISTTQNRLRLPIAPPSPGFDGLNQDINTEPFPAFDCTEISSTTLLHCILHCDRSICQHQQSIRGAQFDCTCVSSSSHATPRALQAPRPPMTLLNLDDAHSRASAKALLASKPADTEIAIHLSEALAQLQHLAVEAAAKALCNEAFMAALRASFPGRKMQMAVLTMDLYLDTMTAYFARSVQRARPRAVVLGDMRREMEVYMWTMLRDWVDLYGEDEDECYRILTVFGPDLVRAASSEAPGAVMDLWRGTTQVLVESLVWRDEKAKEQDEGTLFWVVLAIVVVLWAVW